MALTTELLNANAVTAALTDVQKTAIVEMSMNDETTVIGQKTGEIYGGLDADILAASGIAKNGTEKTYDYAKRVIGEIKSQAGNNAELQTKVSDLEKEKTRLEGIIAKGGADADAETKRQLEQAKTDLANVQSQYATLKMTMTPQRPNTKRPCLVSRLTGNLRKRPPALSSRRICPQM